MPRFVASLALALALTACANNLGPAEQIAANEGDSLPVLDDHPIDEEPIDEEPIDEEPIDEEPIDEEPVNEEPIDEEPIDEEPVDPIDPVDPAQPYIPSIDVGAQLPAVCPEDDGASSRGVVAIEKGLGGGVRLFALNDKGKLTDSGLRIDVSLPMGLAFRRDGLEALVSYGTSSSGLTGVLVLDVAADGSAMAVKQDLLIDPTATPLEVDYTSLDSAIVSRIGPGNDNLVPLSRAVDGKFSAGAAWDVPGEWPQRALGVPGQDNRALLLRADILAPENGSEVIPLSDVGGVITVVGPSVSFSERPLFMYMHPEGERAYVPTGEPSDDDLLNPAGRLEVLSPTGTTWDAAPSPFSLPERASLAAVSPLGDNIVFADGVLSWGPTGVYIETAWAELYRVTLDASGQPTGADPDIALFPSSLLYAVAQSPAGHAVVAYDTGSLVAGVSDVVVVYSPGEDGWVQVCDPIEVDGSIDLVVSPAP